MSDESKPSALTTAVVRLLGVGLLIAGLLIAALIMMEAWALYKYPEKIELFAQAVEHGSNIDKTLRPRANDGSQSENTGSDAIRLSYFFAWFIVFFLILLIGRIAMTAINTGGRLALYDTDIRRLARAILEETRVKSS